VQRRLNPGFDRAAAAAYAQPMVSRCRWLLLQTAAFSLAPGGCGPIEVGECDEISQRDDCEDADVEFGACHWVDVFTPTFDLTGCDPGRAHGRCIGFSGTQQGCASIACAPPMEDVIDPFARERGDITEVFASPVCGPRPAGDWEACDPGDPACQCLCQIGMGE